MKFCRYPNQNLTPSAIYQILFILFFGGFILSCKSSKPKPPAFTAKPPVGDIFLKFYEVPENFHAAWEGTFPCPDCPGLNFTLILNPDYTFSSSAIKEEVIGKQIEMTGVYMMRSDSMITLVHQGLEIHHLAIRSDKLLLLNNEGNPIIPELKNYYFLSKNSLSFSGPGNLAQKAAQLPEQSSWKLISLNGFTIKGNYVLGKDPTLSLNMLTKRGRGYAGCNNFGFRFTSEYNYLTLQYIVLQDAPCFTGYVEEDYIFYLHQSPFQYEIFGDKMFLRSARGYALEFKKMKD